MKKSSLLLSVLLLIVFSTSALASVEVTLFGEKTYERTKGKPNIYVDTFEIVGLSGYGKLIIQNGNDKKSRVSSAIVKFNGKIIAGTGDLNKNVESIEISVELGEQNEISVELRSKPGSYLVVKVVQEVEAEAAAVIGPEGGVFEVTDPESPICGAKITVQEDAVSENVGFTISIPDDTIDIPPFLENVSTRIELGPSGKVFEKDIIIDIPYDENEVDEENLTVFLYDYIDNRWEPANINNFDKDNNVVTISTLHFSQGAVANKVIENIDTILKLIQYGTTGAEAIELIATSIESDPNGEYFVITKSGDRYPLKNGGIELPDGNIYCIKEMEKEDPNFILEFVKFAVDPRSFIEEKIVEAGKYMSDSYKDWFDLTGAGYFGALGSHAWDKKTFTIVELEDGRKLDLTFSVGLPKYPSCDTYSYLVIKNPLGFEIWRDELGVDLIEIEYRVGDELLLGFQPFSVGKTRKEMAVKTSIFNTDTYSNGQFAQFHIKLYKRTLTGLNYIGNISNLDEKSKECEFESGIDGLIAYYPLDSNANDESGSGTEHIGTPQGNTNFVDIDGRKAAYFDGYGDYIEISPNMSSELTNSPYTFSAWFKATGMPYNSPHGVLGPILFNSYHCKDNALSIGPYGSDKIQVDFYVHTGCFVGADTQEGNLELNEWYHVAGTVDDTNLKLYVNGQLVDTLNVGYSEIDTWEGSFSIGGDLRLSYYFKGYIDDVQIYNRALPIAEIQLLANP